MFKYTKAALNKLVGDFKKIPFWCGIGVQTFGVFYYVYALVAGAGETIINAILLAVSVFFLGFGLVESKFGKALDKDYSNVKKLGANIIKTLKVCVQIFNVGSLLYSLAYVSSNVVYVLLLALRTVLLILQIVFTAIGWILPIIVNEIVGLVKDGVKEDLTQPFAEAGRKTSNFFRRLLGKEEKAAPEQTRHQKILHAQAEKDTQKRLQLQRQQKEEKRAKKIAKKEQKIAEKTAKKAEKQAGKKVKVKALPAETELAAADELKTE